MFSFSIFIHLSTYSLTVHPLSQQLFTEQLLCPEPGAVRIQPPWDAVPVSLYLFVSASAVLLFHLLLFFPPYIFEANSVGLGPSVSVFGKGFDYSVRCYKSLNRVRHICDPFPKKIHFRKRYPKLTTEKEECY